MLIVLDICISIADILFLLLLLFIIHFYTEPAGTVETRPAPVFSGWAIAMLRGCPLPVFFLLVQPAKNLAGFLGIPGAMPVSMQSSFPYFREQAHRLTSKARYARDYINAWIHPCRRAGNKFSMTRAKFAQHVLGGGIQQIITQAALILPLNIVRHCYFQCKTVLLAAF